MKRWIAWLSSTLALWLTLGSATLAQDAAVQYLLAPGDGIRITVYQNPDLTLETRVGEAGAISFPLLRSVQIGGLSVRQAEQRIADGLRNGGFVKQPQVSLMVMQVRGHQVSVLGQVTKPGRYPLEVAEVRLTDMLAIAGGVSVTGGDNVVVVGVRNGQPYRVEVDLPAIFAPGRRGEDVLLQHGDVIWVERTAMVYLYGDVGKPGPVRLERGMTVMQALAAGGGIGPRGTERGMRVHRRDAQGRVRVMEVAMTEALRPDDIVFVRESVF